MLALFAVAAGGAPPAYIEDVFSTFLFTGNRTNRSIVNNIDLAGKGGMVWLKNRTSAQNGTITDTVRGVSRPLTPSLTDASGTPPTSGGVSAFNADGFSILAGENSNYYIGENSVSWTFREQSKFFDVVTYTGTGADRTISHSLGSEPGSIWVKRTNTTGAWQVYHRSLANTEYLVLNTTAAKATGATRWNSTTATASVFSLGTDATVNASGGSYVAYIFAHNAGGFGQAGTDNAISCGSYVKDGSGNATINLGYEPQWIIAKPVSTTGRWYMYDVMRGLNMTEGALLSANLADAESSYLYFNPTATGFNDVSGSDPGETYVYIAIRRGPMRVPTTGTSVFEPVTYSGDSSPPRTIGGSNIISDFTLWANRFATAGNGTSRPLIGSRLAGTNVMQTSSSTRFESDYTGYLAWGRTQLGVDLEQITPDSNETGQSYILYLMRRAPSCMDVVCYTGTGSNTTQAHNLGVVPELIIFKRRNAASAWNVYSSSLLNTEYLIANTTAAKATGATRWNSTTATASVFSLGTETAVNASGGTYVAYLFATAAGVSKVGAYTGTATTKQIDCGFTGGARFVMIKRTDSTGDWYVWDSARGIIAGNDPYLLLNGTTAEVTGTDYVDTYAAGFELSSTAPAAINASGGTYIFLAIA
jgi:hypothetical protein